MECPKKCDGELKPFVMNGVKYAQCNKCGSIFAADALQADTIKSPPPKQKKKGNSLKTILGLVGAFFVVLVIAFIFIDPEEDDISSEDKTLESKISEDRPLSEFMDDVIPMESLLFQVEAGVSNTKYDGYTLDYDETSMTINVWRESITTTADLLLSEGASADDDNWVWLKNNTGNTPDYICDCIKSSGHDMTLTFNVLDDKDHDRVLMTFTDTDLVYDILAQ